MVVYPSHHKHMLCFEQTQALSSPLGSSFGCPEISVQETKTGYTTPLGCVPEGLIYPREHNTLSKKSDSRGETLGIY